MFTVLLEHPQFLGHRRKPSWVFAPQPRKCLHRPTSSQQLHTEGIWVCRCRVQNSGPSVWGLAVQNACGNRCSQIPQIWLGRSWRRAWALTGRSTSCFYPIHPARPSLGQHVLAWGWLEITPASWDLGSHMSYCHWRDLYDVQNSPDTLHKNVVLCIFQMYRSCPWLIIFYFHFYVILNFLFWVLQINENNCFLGICISYNWRWIFVKEGNDNFAFFSCLLPDVSNSWF